MSIPARNSSHLHITSTTRTFFVTSATFGHRALLQSDQCATLLVEVLQHHRHKGKFRLHAFVVMPDHFHALLTLDNSISVEKAVQMIKGGYSFRASRELGSRGEIWQRGFSEVRIQSREQFDAHRAYIHENPVRRHLCENANEYPFSSAFTGAKALVRGSRYGTTKVVP